MTTAEHSIVQRSIRLRMPLLSLRTIVIVAALAVIVTVLTIGTWVWIGITNEQHNQLDRRLDSVSSLGDVNALLRAAMDSNADEVAPKGNMVRT
ncbi:two-component sensor histidine kinase, partial [Mycolicibacterium insubricum]